MSHKLQTYILAFGLISLAVLLRLSRHYGVLHFPPNFAPITAIAIFSGLYLRNVKLALLIPLLSMLITDLFIGFYDWRIMLAVYLSFLTAGILGIWLQNHKSLKWILIITASSATFFFVVTNFAVWLYAGLYPHNLLGFLNCYLMAWPFFKNTLAGDFFYLGFLLAPYELINIFYQRRLKNEGLLATTLTSLSKFYSLK